MRAQHVVEHNEEVRTKGVGQYLQLRDSDLDPEAGKRRFFIFCSSILLVLFFIIIRYNIFKTHLDTINVLQQYFLFSIIDASGSKEVKKFIYLFFLIFFLILFLGSSRKTYKRVSLPK